MFSVISEGNVIGYVDAPNYIYYSEKNKCFMSAKTRKDAQGLSFQSKVYNLPGFDVIKRETFTDDLSVDGDIITTSSTDENGETVETKQVRYFVVAPIADVSEQDSSEILFDNGQNIKALENENIVIQTALCDLDEQISQINNTDL